MDFVIYMSVPTQINLSAHVLTLLSKIFMGITPNSVVDCSLQWGNKRVALQWSEYNIWNLVWRKPFIALKQINDMQLKSHLK